MIWKFLALAACAVMVGAAAKAPVKKPPPRPAAKPAAVAFDARDPASLVTLLTQMGAKAEIAGASDDMVDLKVVTPGYSFAAQFAGCAATKRDCKALAFSTLSDRSAPTLLQINGFNQTSIACKAWQDKAGKAHIMYAFLVTGADSRDEMQLHVGAWQGCLVSFGEFLADPPGYLAAAP